MTQFIRLDMGPESPIQAQGNLDNQNGYLCLGNIPNAIEWLREGATKRFKAILNCTDDPALDWAVNEQWVDIRRLNQWDGEEYPERSIKAGIDFIRDNMDRAASVLVCCHAGMSRSPGMVLAYLMSLGYDYNESVQIVRKARPIIQIHPKIDLSIRKYFGLAPRTAADLIPGSSSTGY